jgi:CRISPR-associated endonuclease/helicase Cas3
MELVRQIKLAEQPNIMALLQTLEDNRLNKEKQEVEALVNCLDSMEERYGKILGEMQGIREELGKMGAVYIVQMAHDAEHLERLREIRDAQAALQKILDDFKYDNKKFNYSLDSEIAIKFYYSVYRSQLRKLETKFPVEVCGVTVTLTDLLGKNQIGQNQYCRKHKEKVRTKLPQAFQTAGSEFEVISDTYKLSVVVPYGIEPKLLLKELSQVRTETEKKKILRKLQRYTVGISESRRNKLGNTVYENSEGILVLCDGYYDKKVGVVDEPKMDFCNI